ncbi:MAG: Type secretory pathway VirD4 component-like [Frankiales bacterium]|nr:Type secretory pathway VirD4 component-like [Frankiales bacterium]
MTSRPRGSSDPLAPGDQLLLAAVAALTILAGAAWLLAAVAATLAGDPRRASGLGSALSGAAAWSHHLSDPGAGYPALERTALPGAVGMWTALLLTASAAVALGLLAIRLTRRLRNTGDHQPRGTLRAGLASRGEIRGQLSERAVRARAAHARPQLTGHPPATEVGLRLGRDLHTRIELWGSIEDSFLVLGPPRSGKGVHLVIPHALDAPGALLVTSTRPDTLHATRAVREQHGPVLAFDPQQLAPDAPRLRWSPTRGCHDPLVAINRARALSAGAAPHGATTADADFWTGMTAAVLRAYLHAAALTSRPMGEVLGWASRPLDPTPVRILRRESQAAAGWAEELAAQAGADPRQRDSVWAGVRRAVDSLADPRVLATCSPNEHDAFDPHAFLQQHGSLYLLGATGTQLSVAPLITALLEDLLDTARTLAAGQDQGRLDPPLMLLLDEAANIAPIPSLPNLLADGGGTGITTVTVLQSLAQARARWGDAGADAMWDASTTKVILGGLAHADDLTRISRLAGDVDVPHVTRNSSATGGSRSISSQRLPALPLERIRCLPAGQALVIARRCPPVHVELTPWWQHPSQTHPRTRRPARR